MRVSVGGGMRTVDDVRRLLRGSAPTMSRSPRRWTAPLTFLPKLRSLGAQSIVVAIEDKSPRRRIALENLHPRRPHADAASTRWTSPNWRALARQILLSSPRPHGDKTGYDVALSARSPDGGPVPSSPRAASQRPSPHRRRPRRRGRRGPRRLHLPFRREQRHQAKEHMAMRRPPHAARSLTATTTPGPAIVRYRVAFQERSMTYPASSPTGEGRRRRRHILRAKLLNQQPRALRRTQRAVEPRAPRSAKTTTASSPEPPICSIICW